MSRHSARAGAALRALSESDPALAALALWCEHRDRLQGPAAETRGSTIHYGPGFQNLPRHEQIGLAAHHILHVALRHTGRMQAMALRFGEAFDAEVYNIAADAIVNEALMLSGYALPRPALALTALLESALGLRVSAAEALADWDADRLYVQLMQGERGGEGRARQRARAHAASRDFSRDMIPAETPQDGPQEKGSDQDEAEWRRHLARAMDAGRSAGRGIGMIGHRLADIPAPETPWEVLLRGLVTRAVTPLPRPSHRRPSRAWIAMEAEARRTGGPSPAFQPGLARAAPVPRIAVALDCSGSVDDARLAMFMGEVAGIARRTAAEVHVIVFDEAVHGCLRIDPAGWRAQLAGIALARGGGTDFGPALAQASALGPSVIVVLTDLEGPFGPAPRVPVIWAVPDAHGAPPPPFGRVLDLGR